MAFSLKRMRTPLPDPAIGALSHLVASCPRTAEPELCSATGEPNCPEASRPAGPDKPASAQQPTLCRLSRWASVRRDPHASPLQIAPRHLTIKSLSGCQAPPRSLLQLTGCPNPVLLLNMAGPSEAKQVSILCTGEFKGSHGNSSAASLAHTCGPFCQDAAKWVAPS